MKALVMHSYYIPQVLYWQILFDVWRYDTWVKCDVYIYDSKAKSLVDIIAITGTHRVTVENYCDWHHMPLDIENTDMSHEYYAWDFINPRRTDYIKVYKPKDKKVWLEILYNQIGYTKLY